MGVFFVNAIQPDDDEAEYSSDDRWRRLMPVAPEYGDSKDDTADKFGAVANLLYSLPMDFLALYVHCRRNPGHAACAQACNSPCVQ